MEKKAVILLNSDLQQDGFVSVSNPAKGFNHNTNNNDDDVSNMKHSSSLVNNCNNFNSNSNSNSNSNINSNCNNKNVNVIDTGINEIDQSNQNVDNILGQGTVGNLKKKKVVLSLNYDFKQAISASVSNVAKRIDNNNNNDNGDVSITKQSSSLGYTRNNYNKCSNSNSQSNNNMSK